jgi:hypothetical protein
MAGSDQVAHFAGQQVELEERTASVPVERGGLREIERSSIRTDTDMFQPLVQTRDLAERLQRSRVEYVQTMMALGGEDDFAALSGRLRSGRARRAYRRCAAAQQEDHD